MAECAKAFEFEVVRDPWRESRKPSAKLDANTFRYDDPEFDLWSVCHYDAESDVFDEVDSALRQEGLPAVERAVRAAETRAERRLPPTEAEFADLKELKARVGGDPFVAHGAGTIVVPVDVPWLEALALAPELVERALEAQVATALKVIPHLPKFGVHGLWAGGDLASTKGPIYSPATFRRVLLPRLRTITQAAHEAGLVYVFRTDGNLWPIASGIVRGLGDRRLRGD